MGSSCSVDTKEVDFTSSIFRSSSRSDSTSSYPHSLSKDAFRSIDLTEPPLAYSEQIRASGDYIDYKESLSYTTVRISDGESKDGKSLSGIGEHLSESQCYDINSKNPETRSGADENIAINDSKPLRDDSNHILVTIDSFFTITKLEHQCLLSQMYIMKHIYF